MADLSTLCKYDFAIFQIKSATTPSGEDSFLEYRSLLLSQREMTFYAWQCALINADVERLKAN